MAIRRGKFTASVPMSSMADIAFLLLVFFMVTSVLKVEADIPLELPDAAGQELRENEVALSIAKNEAYYLNNTPMAREDVMARIRVELQEKPDVRVLISAHRDLSFALVQNLLELLKEAGVSNFAMVTKQENRKI